eukprot:1182838-Prorocentrum_minimum.AAC.1
MSGLKRLHARVQSEWIQQREAQVADIQARVQERFENIGAGHATAHQVAESKKQHDERQRARKIEAEQRALIRQEAAVEE